VLLKSEFDRNLKTIVKVLLSFPFLEKKIGKNAGGHCEKCALAINDGDNLLEKSKKVLIEHVSSSSASSSRSLRLSPFLLILNVKTRRPTGDIFSEDPVQSGA